MKQVLYYINIINSHARSRQKSLILQNTASSSTSTHCNSGSSSSSSSSTPTCVPYVIPKHTRYFHCFVWVSLLQTLIIDASYSKWGPNCALLNPALTVCESIYLFVIMFFVFCDTKPQYDEILDGLVSHCDLFRCEPCVSYMKTADYPQHAESVMHINNAKAVERYYAN